jgi:hypothetical protein
VARSGRGRSGADYKRKGPKRPPFDRILVVCEGKKTEPNYLEEIRQRARISNMDLRVIHSKLGTEPQQIVESAEREFRQTLAYEKIYVVFDRDDHQTYANAIAMSEARDGRHKNDQKNKVGFEAVVSVPSFELWLLLHFADIQAWLHRDEALARLRTYLPGYEKGSAGVFKATESNLEIATDRGVALKARCARIPGDDAYTDVHELVATLRNLKAV